MADSGSVSGGDSDFEPQELIQPTQDSVQQTQESVEGTQEADEVTQASVELTQESVEGTKASVELTQESVEETEESVEAKQPSVEETEESVEATQASVEETQPSVEQTQDSDFEETEAHAEQTQHVVPASQITQSGSLVDIQTYERGGVVFKQGWIKAPSRNISVVYPLWPVLQKNEAVRVNFMHAQVADISKANWKWESIKAKAKLFWSLVASDPKERGSAGRNEYITHPD